MFEVAGTVALSIFITCTLFFVVYGLAYLGIVWSFSLIKKIKEKIRENKSDKVDNVFNIPSEYGSSPERLSKRKV